MSQDASDVLYSNGLRIPTQVVLEAGRCFAQTLPSEQVLKIWKIKL